MMLLYLINILMSLYTFLFPVPLEMRILMREHFNRWYRLAPYYISILMVEIPFQAACAASYLVVSYWLTGQPVETNRIIFFMVVSIAASLTAQAWGFFIGVTTPIKVNVSSLSDTAVIHNSEPEVPQLSHGSEFDVVGFQDTDFAFQFLLCSNL